MKLCEVYQGEFYQDGIKKYSNYLPLSEVVDFKADLVYKGKRIVIKKVVNFNTYHIFIPVDIHSNIELLIRMKTVTNTVKNLFGKGSKVNGEYEYIGSEKLVDKILDNNKLVELISENDIFIEIRNSQIPSVLLRPFRGIESLKKGEEYLQILYLLEKEVNEIGDFRKLQ